MGSTTTAGRAGSAHAAVVIPVKDFTLAKRRLAESLDAPDRATLAERMATVVVRAAAPLDPVIVCESENVRAWAHDVGARVIWTPGLGLNGAVERGVETLRSEGVARAVVAHGDLPLALSLGWLGEPTVEGVVIVPDRHLDGSNVMSVPTDIGFRFAYGTSSFDAHRTEARRLGQVIRVVRDDRLSWDVDHPADLPRSPFPGDRRRSSVLSVSDADPTAPPDLPTPAPPPITAAIGRDLPVPESALAIGAHPDDVEFGCGATLAKWAAAGCTIHHLVCTDGSKGTWDPTTDPAALVATRQHEQRAAARALGSTGEVVFLGWPDGELDSSLRHRWQVAYWIRKLSPTVVLGHDPWKRYRLHPDHRHAGLLAVEGIVAARDPLFFTEQELPHHRPDALLLWEADEPDHVEDATGHEDAKLDALRAHVSQFRSTMGVDVDDPTAEVQWGRFADRIRDRMREWGRLGGCELGEGFKKIDRL